MVAQPKKGPRRVTLGGADVIAIDPAPPSDCGAADTIVPRGSVAAAIAAASSAAASSAGSSSDPPPGRHSPRRELGSAASAPCASAPGESWGPPGKGPHWADPKDYADPRRWHWRDGRWWYKSRGTGPDGGSNVERSADPARTARNAARKAQKARSQARRQAEDEADPDGAAARAFRRTVENQRAKIMLERREIDPEDL